MRGSKLKRSFTIRTAREVGQMLGITKSAVLNCEHRAFKKIRKAMRKFLCA